MAVKKSVKKYIGVYDTESKIRRWRERRDRCYWIAFKEAKTGRAGSVAVGHRKDGLQRQRRENATKPWNRTVLGRTSQRFKGNKTELPLVT